MLRNAARILRILACVFPLFFIVFASPDEDIPKEDGVLVLSEKNFQNAIETNKFILVEFYAPWCGHCKQFAPEYAAAAQLLQLSSPSVPLAKIDATVEHKIAEQYSVRGYPTMLLFVDGKSQEYTGGRTQQSILTWTLKKVGPPAVLLTDEAAAQSFEKENSLAVIGVFEEGADRSVFDTVARQVEDVMFACSSSPQVAARYGLPLPGVKMLFPHEERSKTFDGNLQVGAELLQFVKAHRRPLVMHFNGEVAAEIFGDGRPVFFLFRETSNPEGKAAEAEVRKEALSFGRRMLISIAGSSEPMDQRLMDYASVEPEEFPTIRVLTDPSGSMKKYRFVGGEITQASISQFVSDFEGGKVPPYLRSEPPPTSQAGPVFKIVGSTFDKVVMDPTKDVLVEFYAPWCGHCKKLEPVYTEVAKKLEGVGTILIAKIDATVNDVDGIDVDGFPTIKMWRANSKQEPLNYDGDRDVDGFLAWLEEKSTHPFNRGVSKTEL